MNIISGVIAGIIGGAIGAAVWAGISYATGYEIGWIAWGVGLLVGFGVAWGGKGQGTQAGAFAAAITILAMLGGKYASASLMIMKEAGNETEFVENALSELQNDELVVSYIADDFVAERINEGQEVQWPANVDPSQASAQADYPPEIWGQAQGQWDGMSTEEREGYREELSTIVAENAKAFYASANTDVFLASFGLMDLLFFGLGISTSFQVASRGRGGNAVA